jgi:hypothetical protein
MPPPRNSSICPAYNEARSSTVQGSGLAGDTPFVVHTSDDDCCSRCDSIPNCAAIQHSVSSGTSFCTFVVAPLTITSSTSDENYVHYRDPPSPPSVPPPAPPPHIPPPHSPPATPTPRSPPSPPSTPPPAPPRPPPYAPRDQACSSYNTTRDTDLAQSSLYALAYVATSSVSDPTECCWECLQNPTCKGFTLVEVGSICHLKSTNVVSGVYAAGTVVYYIESSPPPPPLLPPIASPSAPVEKPRPPSPPLTPPGPPSPPPSPPGATSSPLDVLKTALFFMGCSFVLCVALVNTRPISTQQTIENLVDSKAPKNKQRTGRESAPLLKM